MTGDRALPHKRVTGETVAERLPRIATERILPARYLQRENGEVVETPAELVERVARAVASAETTHGNDPDTWADRFEQAMADLAFVPNSPTLMNAGLDDGQLSACFVISPADDLRHIFETVGDAATIFQTGGGVGYSFSRLRPRGDPVTTGGGRASGPVSFMTVFDRMCDVVRQGGRRRGAQMAVLRVDHPDIGRFVTAKREGARLTNFNVSVGLTDRFLAAVEEDERYPLVNPRTGDQHVATAATAAFYNEGDTRDGEPNLWQIAADVPDLDEFPRKLVTVGEPTSLPARLVWHLVVDGAWHNGEPGLFHLDRANREHAFDVATNPDHRIEATNPCGEQPLEDFEACTLGHVNLSLLVEGDAPDWRSFDGSIDRFLDRAMDWDRLADLTRLGVRFLDDVTTVSRYPLAAIEETVATQRKIGLGVMGFAELLLQLGVRYDETAALGVADRVMDRIDRVATRASHDLARERGSFPRWPESKYADPSRHEDWFRRHTGEEPAEWVDGYPIRNHGVTSVAPTGTTSMIAGTSAGIEPLYDVVYRRAADRDVQGDEPFVAVDPYFRAVLESRGVDVSEIREAARDQMRDGTYAGPSSLPIPDDLGELFVTARDVPPETHVRIQSAFQSHVDGAVSKTVNLPASAVREDVAAAYRLALETDCLGCTVYRSGSRDSQVLSTADDGDT
ncbi:Ribonucleotide reductase, alpha subunit [Halanaeroarchaeum sp. HSR-CO]|uniref:adenosylcobalamin-dependent ribonucleoside-diphosphate reductase n=1 Tax=Halanaeroarchaeum sp. HSR-CO TaxID=2866382 RepID=UPI00217CDE51|nr:adenosylcobalamin-dependent ribonucleoside-diphosphate reductase [Halanaeroarchaeum sp. HSR-CO]UWG48844.1 Ribonucleotide reductase, alpha subunit [Halanaeroarchaeum sp. HSR-CO]